MDIFTNKLSKAISVPSAIFENLMINFKLKPLLKYLARKYEIKRLYYPGSGADKRPSKALGSGKVYHVSLEKYGPERVEYFKKLKAKHRFIADFTHSPFRDNFFDATLIFGTPSESTIKAIEEFVRVTKLGGLIILYADYKDDTTYADVCKLLGDRFAQIEIPFIHRILAPKIYVYLVIK